MLASPQWQYILLTKFPNRYPAEAEQDSFYYAVGGFPDSLRILGGSPGASFSVVQSTLSSS
jgi:hypothetical protein